MRFIKYKKYVPNPAGEMSLEDLVNALADYFLQSGFQNPYLGFYEMQGEHTLDGFQMITRDGATGQVRSWVFDTDGNFGEATWAREGQKWVLDTAGVQENGVVVAATNILTRLDDDAFTFQSVNRTVGGEEAADIPPVRVTRVKGKVAP